MRRSRLTTTVPSLLLLGAVAITLPACGKKKAPEAAAGAGETVAEAGAITATMPEGKDAMTYAGKLVATTVENWEPISGGGDVKFTYNKMTFNGDGTWMAKATLEASFEKTPCVENDTWAIQSVESTNVATMMWTVKKTSCPTREAGAEQRVEMAIPKVNSYQINFR